MPHDLMHQYGMFYTKAIAEPISPNWPISSGYKDIDACDNIGKLSSVLVGKTVVFREFGRLFL